MELKEKQAARNDRLTNLQSAVDEVELEKKKAQRKEAAKQLEEQSVGFIYHIIYYLYNVCIFAVSGLSWRWL